MAIKPRNFTEGIVLKEKTTALDTEGQLANKDSKIKAYTDGAEREVVTNDQTQTLTNKSIDADNNPISNLEVDNLKAGVLNTDLSGPATDTEIPSALAVKTALEGQNEASEITYDPTLNPETSATNVQDALDDTGIASQAAQDAIDAHIADAVDAHDASAISNVPAGNLAATDVQGALNELQTDVDTRATDADLQAHINDATDAHDASAISNVPSGNLAATDVQGALDELQSDVDTRALDADLAAHTGASSGVHGVTGNVVGTTDTQTLTNKTLSGASVEDPTRLDVKKDTLANLTVYATSATNGQLVFATDTKEMYQVVDNELVSVGGSGVGGVDIFHVERFEQTEAADTSTGNNASFLGGGSFAGTVSDETVAPIKGDRSLKYTQAVGSLNDYIALPAFSIDKKEQGQIAGVKITTTSNGNNNEVNFIVYDVTNASVIGTLPIKASSLSLTQELIFNIPSNSTSLRYGIQTVVENPTSEILIDDVEFKVNPLTPTNIRVSDETAKDFTVTPVTTAFGTLSAEDGKYWRDGKFMYVEATFTAGTIDGNTAAIQVPEGLTIDHQYNSNKTIGSSSTQIVGKWAWDNANSNNGGFVLLLNGSNNIFFSGGGVFGNSGQNAFTRAAGTQMITTGTTVTFSAKIPILEWRDTAQGVVVKNVESTDIANTNEFSATILGNGSVEKENLSGWIKSVSNPSAGTYDITFADGLFSTPPIVHPISIGRSGVGTYVWANTVPTTSGIRILTSNNGYGPAGTLGNIAFGIQAIRQGDDFVKESDRIYTVPVDSLTGNYVRAEGTSGAADGVGTVIDFIEVSDTAGAWDGSSYTVQKNNSIVDVKGTIAFTASGISRQIYLYKNGSAYKRINDSLPNDESVYNFSYVSIPNEFVAGDVLSIRNAAGSATGNRGTGTDNNWITIIERYGDRGIFLGTFGQPVAYLKDVKPSGTNGGTFTSGAWQTRDLNELTGDTSFVSLSSNQFTLERGVYEIEASAPAFKVDNHACKLRDVTNSVDSLIGSAEACSSADNVGTSSFIKGQLVVTDTTTFELQHRCVTTQASNGFGTSPVFGTNDVYSQISIRKIR